MVELFVLGNGDACGSIGIEDVEKTKWERLRWVIKRHIWSATHIMGVARRRKPGTDIQINEINDLI